MDFGTTAEQDELRDAEKGWLTRHDPIARVREKPDTAVELDTAAVTHAADSGLLALLTADMGGSHTDLAVLSEAHGYAASALPLADLALGTWLLSSLGLPEAADAESGQLLVSVVQGPVASLAGHQLELTGESGPIPMASDIDRFIVVGEYPGGQYAAVRDRSGLRQLATLDLTRTWGRLQLDGAAQPWMPLPVGMLGHLGDALALHRAVDSVGAAARLLEMTVTYAGQREQFGVPIGSFQAVKHHCANMALKVEASRAVCWSAALALGNAPDASEQAVAAACAYAKAATSEVASTALQVHGGIGFTWEHDLHLLLRRIKVNEAFNGSVAVHRRTLVRS